MPTKPESKNNGVSVMATVSAIHSDSDRRIKRRVKIAQPVRVRPSEPGFHFDEVRATINVCRDGVYFSTDENYYKKGMRVFVTMPYSDAPGAINLEYIGEVVRVDKLTYNQWGVAVHLKMTVNAVSDHGAFRHMPAKF